jgi:hypothetical protein
MVPVVGDTVIFCRPEQLPEAAVALSCCPADRFTPLIVMERSPISDDEYRIRYEAYVEARDRRDAIVGGPLARQEALVNLAAVEAANREVDTKAEALTPYRSWWRHQLFIRDLLGAVAPRLAVFLFEPASHELQLIEAVPISRIGDQRMPLLPEGLKCVHVLAGAGQEDEAGNRFPYASLGELTDVAWRACGRADPMPGTSVEVAPADPADVLAGLSRALKRGVPLRARNDDGPAPADPDEDAGGGVPPTEAVLIEVSADATKLLGVQYARQRRAKLVLYPEPDTTGVEAARAAVEARHDDREKTAPTEVKRLGLAALREYIFGDPTIAERIRKLEHTVSQLVPDRVVTAVGDLDLTVFTIGIPYNFVKKKANWANKAIGHVTGDPSLLILTELCRKEADSEVTFSLIFDPGYFQTSETQAVFAALQKRSSYPLVLSGMAGSNMALLHVALHCRWTCSSSIPTAPTRRSCSATGRFPPSRYCSARRCRRGRLCSTAPASPGSGSGGSSSASALADTPVPFGASTRKSPPTMRASCSTASLGRGGRSAARCATPASPPRPSAPTSI